MSAGAGIVGSIAVLSLALGSPSKEPSPQELSFAREQFKLGVAAAKEGRWEDARSAFARGYELAAHPQILFNLAGAEAQTGRLVQAAESYHRFLREPSSSFVDDHRQEVEAVLDGLVRRIPRIVIRVAGLGPLDELRQDGVPISRAVIGASLPIDPGSHLFGIMRSGQELDRAKVSVGEGAIRDVLLTVPPPEVATDSPIAAKVPVAAVPQDPRHGAPPGASRAGVPGDSSDLPAAILWLAIGSAALAGAIALGFAIPGDREPYRGTTGIALRGLAEP